MAFVVLMAQALETPVYGGVLFSSDWDTALGTSDNALGDGGVYSHVVAGEPYVDLEVFEPDHPVLAGNNYLAVWLEGNDHWGGVYEWDVWLTTAEDIYFRFYQRTYPHNVAPDYIDFTSGHFVQPFQVYPGDLALSTNTLFGINNADATQWSAYIASVAHGGYKWPYPYNRVRLGGLDTGKWYRIECYIHYFRAMEEDAGEGQTRVPTHTFFKIYDENDILVKDTNDWILGDGYPPGHATPDYTLQEWYDMGRYYWMEGNANSWNMGCNGPASASGTGRAVDYAAAEIRDDTWPGPVGGGPQPPGQATNPNPSNGATDVSIDADISWTAGSGAASHDVYFGTDSTPDSGEFQSNQTETTFDPGTMVNDTTYYWRIDEINASGTTTGSVWSFTTEAAAPPPGQASNPTPTDGATGVSVDPDLSWTAGSGSDSSNVYFGTDQTPDETEFQGNQTETTFDPGTMANDTTYYWRIDEVNAAGTTTGNVWSFTTIVAAPGQASNPSPSDSATDVSVTADLSWTVGSGATSHDVYFGTSSPGTFQGNQTATTFDPGTMDNDTTYHWRIDEIGAGGTITGTVWSFTTIAAAGDQLVGWWKLDESAGTNAVDSSGKGYDGTLVGASWAPSSGKFAGAVSFNNVDFADRVDVPITEMTASAGSISLWGKFPGTRSGVRYFFGHTSIPATGYSDRIQLFMENDDTQLDLGLGDNHFRHTDIMALSVDTWYHIVLTWDAGNYTVYVDTDVKATGTYTGLDTLASVASIGNDGRETPDNGAFYGLLDDMRVYNYALGQDEVDDLYNAGVTPPGQAGNPNPSNGATDISIDADLSWTEGSSVDSHDVYFGTSSPGSF